MAAYVTDLLPYMVVISNSFSLTKETTKKILQYGNATHAALLDHESRLRHNVDCEFVKIRNEMTDPIGPLAELRGDQYIALLSTLRKS